MRNWLIKRLGCVDAGLYYADMRAKDEEIARLTKLFAETPEDCKRGKWCEKCEFSMPATVQVGMPGCRHEIITYFCARGELCKNFVRKKTS